MSERPYRVLVVCTGNTCRSPMAEALLRRLFEAADVDAEVRSAGTAGLAGRPAHPYAVDAAAEIGLDVTGHVASALDGDLVRWADTVLGMSPGHVRAARDLDPAADVRLVTEFGDGGSPDGILDPIGYERDVYDEVLEEMKGCLEAFVTERAAHRARLRSESGSGPAG